MRFAYLPVMFLLLVVSSLQASVQPAEVQTMIRDINLPGDDLKSLAIDMKLRLPGSPLELLCQLRYRSAGQYSLAVYDGSDSVPVLVVAEGLALVNDPLAERPEVIASAGVLFELLPQEGRYTANFAFNMPANGEIRNRISLDFKTMFSRLCENLELSTASDGRLIFSGATIEKSRCRAELLPSASFPIQTLQLFVAEGDQPVLDFGMIRVDADFSLPGFPLNELLKAGQVDDPVHPEGMFDTMTIMTSVIKAVFARAAMRDASIRQEISRMLGLENYDWDGLSRRDAVRSESLRRLFPPAGSIRY